MASTARMAFVVIPLEGKVKRTKITFVDKTPKGAKVPHHEMKREAREVDAGFMVYFPNGHALRLSAKRLTSLGLDKAAPIANMDGLHSPETPIGRLMLAQTNQARETAFRDLQQETIALALAKVGNKTDLLNREAA